MLRVFFFLVLVWHVQDFGEQKKKKKRSAAE